ncbi:glycosyltransferase family 2 protein [Ursidibacter maritimus]|uniref:glycosyltransferase family 2 protein n=1 Tax=Ursidibacter maritimus TaxID=1331689 RepID=UPI001C4959A2|nr:glycosyltransferase family 2 protein [Ursidibacter maritimus]MBV6541547.1 glycosyltransferase family 2 protein [Ursidibacter maritimus]
MTTTISIAMIVKNEADQLSQCLESVHDWVDEIIILDSGSEDNSKEIALSYHKVKWYENRNWQGFGKQRQLAQSYVTSDYILWLDADERVTPALKESILETLKNKESNTVYQISRLSEVFGKQIKHSGWYPDYVIRLYPTKLTQYNDSLVHEKVITTSSIQCKTLKGDLLHFTYRDLIHYLIKSAQYSEAWATQRFNQNKKVSLLNGLLHAMNSFFKMYIMKKGFLDGTQGFLLAILSSYSVFSKYANLWVKNQQGNK